MPADARVSIARRLRQKWLIWTLGRDAEARAALAMKAYPPEPDRIDLRLRRLTNPVVLRHGGAAGSPDDRRTVWELFRRRAYESPLWASCGSLLDVGANAGLLPVWLAYHDLLPDRYAGIEADPDSAGVLREQVERLPWMVPPRVIEAAAGDRHETVRFDTGGDSVFHGVSRTGGIEVPMRPLADLMDEAGLDRVDIMKLDIEGGETAVIPDAAAWADRVNVIICELHHGLDAAWLDEHLRPLGFRVFDFGVAVREGFAAVREDQLHRVPERMKQKG